MVKSCFYYNTSKKEIKEKDFRFKENCIRETSLLKETNHRLVEISVAKVYFDGSSDGFYGKIEYRLDYKPQEGDRNH